MIWWLHIHGLVQDLKDGFVQDLVGLLQDWGISFADGDTKVLHQAIEIIILVLP